MKIDTTEKWMVSGKFQLTYGNKRVQGNQSLPVHADNIAHAVIKVLGGCDEINGNAYRVGILFGTVERLP